MFLSQKGSLGRNPMINRVGQRLLQLFEGASAAYSLRDLASNIASVVRVRRASDNSEKDFSAADVSSGAMTQWVGSGNDGFVETWYDQSGNGNDAVQSVAGSQPKIVDAGVLVSGGLEFDGVDDHLGLSGSGLDIFKDAGYGQVFTTITPEQTASGSGRYFDAITGTTNARFLLGDSQEYASSSRIGGRRLDSDSFQDIESSTSHGNNETLVTGFLNWADSDAYLYFNGTQVASSTSFQTDGNTSDTSSASVDIGGVGNHGNFKMQELILYTSDQSANRAAIETNINNQYDIY